MQVSYNKLWHLLIDKDMKKAELAQRVHMSYSTLSKLSKNQPVKREVLGRICNVLDCEIDDIVEEIEDPKKGV